MKTTREQFTTQKRRAQQTANFYEIPLDIVVVDYPDTPRRISIIGSAISRAMPDIWRSNGARVRFICRINPEKKAKR